MGGQIAANGAEGGDGKMEALIRDVGRGVIRVKAVEGEYAAFADKVFAGESANAAGDKSQRLGGVAKASEGGKGGAHGFVVLLWKLSHLV
jgi:hypothetical protein